ncbi:MAG: T9SS type A sorting domain-containing protein [Chitinophagaceae bacterium]
MRKVYLLLFIQCVCILSFGQNFYRSFQTGPWDQPSTWESSPDNSIWGPASSTPTSADNTITIQSGHTVTLIAPVTVDEVVIQSGGILTDLTGILTINDNLSGDDLIVQSGGIFILNFASTAPVFSPATATALIKTGGILRVTAGGLTGAGTGVNASNFVYENASALEMDVAFSTDGVTYFPNVNASTIPIFRLLSAVGIVGANNPTVINGVFETAFNITFQNTGTKTFRNGIRGNGDITAGTSGKFIINGLTAELGGTGSLILPTSGGLEVGNPTTVTMITDKTLTGNVTLLNGNSLIQLGNNNLTVTGTIGITQVTSYVKTNGTGKLTLNNVPGPYPFSGKLFPIGLSSINPLFVSSAPTANYSARIVEPITPPIYNDLASVLRTWYISSSTNSPAATIGFGYSYPADCGGLYNNSGPVEVGVNISNVWNIHQTGLTPSAFILPGTFIVVPTISIGYFNGTALEYPFVVSNNGAILPLDFFITARAQKRNGSADISWKVMETDNVLDFELQRSINNTTYQTIATINPVSQQLNYSYTDVNPGPGTNLYRIRANRTTGATRYSNTVAILNGSKGLLITGLAPNPVHDNAQLTLSAARQGTVDFRLYNMYGALVRQWQSPVRDGTNTIPVNTDGIAAGVYQLSASADGEKTMFRLVKQ